MTVAVMETPTEVEVQDENAGIHPFLLDLMSRIDMKPTFKSGRGLLYSFRPEQRNPDRYGGTEKTIQYEVLIKPEIVTLRTVTETCGVNHHSNKIYRSWKTDRAISLSLKAEKHGHRVLRIYENITKTRKYNGSFTNATARYAGNFDIDVKNGMPDRFDLDQVKPEHTFTRTPTLQHKAYTFVGWVLYQIFRELDPSHPAFNARSFATTAAYPVLQLFPNSSFEVDKIRGCLPKKYSLHGELDVKKFIITAFGPEGVRKDMVKAVLSTTDINSLFLAARLKELFPLDWLRDFVKNPLTHMIYDYKKIYTEDSVQGMVGLLSSLTLPQRKRLLVEKIPEGEFGNHDFLIRDSIRMFSDLNPEARTEYSARIDYSSWNNLHETLIQVSTEIRGKEASIVSSRKFDLDGTYMEKLHETSYEVEGGTYKLFAPKNGYDLSKWGNEMHNCIGSYRNQINDKRTNVFAVYHNDVLFANVEISNNGGIVQHMQKYNSRSPQEHFDALAEHIKAVDEKIKKKKAENKRIAEAQNRRRQRELAVA